MPAAHRISVLALVAAVVLAASVLPGVAKPARAGAVTMPGATRVGASGQDAAAFARDLSQHLFDDAAGAGETAAWAVVGRDDGFADSLALGPLLAGAPLLAVPGGPDGELDEATAAELERLLPPGATVYVVGGEDAVGQAVVQAIAGLGFLPTRLGGVDRVATSVAVAAETVRLVGAPQRVLLASAADWPDALAGGALAADGLGPLLLTDPRTLSSDTADFLAAHPDAEVVILGGPVALGDDVAHAAGVDRRVGGATRADTAALLAELWPEPVRATTLVAGFTDDGWQQATAGAGVLAPVLLAGPGPDQLTPVTRSALTGRDGPLLVLGGPDRISDAAIADAATRASPR